MDVAVVSVLVSGIVAVSSLAVPIIVDKLRSSRERTAADLERVNTTTLDLLGELVHFRHWYQRDLEESSGRPIQQVYADLQRKHYAWERAIMPRLDEAGRDSVKKMRKRFEGIHAIEHITKDASSSTLPDLSDEVLQLAYLATEKED
jgi:hypothetical protein